MSIYIPPCIYLNPDAGFLFLCEINNLHSTMYLFKRRRSLNWVTIRKIYIPPCIYLNLATATKQATNIIIYIPPCIYLNEKQDRICTKMILIYIPPCIYLNIIASDTVSASFTIYIPPCIYLNPFHHRIILLSVLEFTFHHVSI